MYNTFTITSIKVCDNSKHSGTAQTPKDNYQSSRWLLDDQYNHKSGNKQQLAGNILVSKFWKAHDTIIISYFRKGETDNNVIQRFWNI